MSNHLQLRPLLAITPPQGQPDPGIVEAWQRAGVLASLMLLLRTPDAPPHELVQGRLAGVLRAAQAVGLPILLSVAGEDLEDAIAVCRDQKLAGLQLRADPSPEIIVNARKRLSDLGLRSAIIGGSYHGVPPCDADRLAVADYVCVAPVFPPKTQQPGRHKLAAGVEMLRAWGATSLRVYALGGIDSTTCRRCMSAGAFGLAGIGAFFPARVSLGDLREFHEAATRVRKLDASRRN